MQHLLCGLVAVHTPSQLDVLNSYAPSQLEVLNCYLSCDELSISFSGEVVRICRIQGSQSSLQ